jgi:DNA modification methylase
MHLKCHRNEIINRHQTYSFIKNLEQEFYHGGKNIMNYIDWLPTQKTCSCPEKVLNCLNNKAWFRNQIPVWWFKPEELQTSFDLASRKIHPAIFPTALAARVIKNYSHRGQTVLDCFCGAGTTLYASKLTGRNAIGIELNSEYAKFSEERLLKFGKKIDEKNQEKNTKQVQICDDARNLLKYIPSNSIDLIWCSPPYWDLLKQRPSTRNLKNQQYLKNNYSANVLDLSNELELDGFIDSIRDIFSKAALVLKPGSRFVINTGDYRKKGKLILLHQIYTELMSDLGLEIKNIIIWDRRQEYDISLFSYPFNFIVNNGMVEYILEFRKVVKSRD